MDQNDETVTGMGGGERKEEEYLIEKMTWKESNVDNQSCDDLAMGRRCKLL
jgi:hypothetical protein